MNAERRPTRLIRSEATPAASAVVATIRYYWDVVGFAEEWTWGEPPEFGGVRQGKVGVISAGSPSWPPMSMATSMRSWSVGSPPSTSSTVATGRSSYLRRSRSPGVCGSRPSGTSTAMNGKDRHCNAHFFAAKAISAAFDRDPLPVLAVLTGSIGVPVSDLRWRCPRNSDEPSFPRDFIQPDGKNEVATNFPDDLVNRCSSLPPPDVGCGGSASLLGRRWPWIEDA